MLLQPPPTLRATAFFEDPLLGALRVVQVLALKLDNLLFVLNLLAADRTYLITFILRVIFLTTFTFADRAEILLPPTLYLVEWFFVLRLFVEDPSVLGEPFLGSVFANVLRRRLACLLLVNRQSAARRCVWPYPLRLEHRG